MTEPVKSFSEEGKADAEPGEAFSEGQKAVSAPVEALSDEEKVVSATGKAMSGAETVRYILLETYRNGLPLRALAALCEAFIVLYRMMSAEDVLELEQKRIREEGQRLSP